MKSSRTILTIALLVCASQSYGMWSRFAKPFTARFATALKSGLMSKKAFAAAAIAGTGISSYAFQRRKTTNNVVSKNWFF